MATVTPSDSPKCNCFVSEVFGDVFVLSLCFFEFSVSIWAFCKGMGQISYFSIDNWSCGTWKSSVIFCFDIPVLYNEGTGNSSGKVIKLKG